MVFDPFLKSQMHIDFESYSDTLFHSINMKSRNDLIFEFESYMNSNIPDEIDISIFGYWLSLVNTYPLLSYLSIEYLCIATNSLDAERSFSKFRDIQNLKRTRLSSKNTDIEMIMYFDDDIEEKFNN